MYEQIQCLKCFCETMHSSVKGVFVLGQRREGEIERERGMTEKGSDRNYYSNSPCRCLEICSPSLLFYLLARSSPLRLPVCLQCSLPMSFLFAVPLAQAPAHLYYQLFLSSACLSFTLEGWLLTSLSVRLTHLRQPLISFLTDFASPVLNSIICSFSKPVITLGYCEMSQCVNASINESVL